MTFAQGALLEPLSVVMHGISRTRLSLGRGALVCGAGPIGLIAIAAARASGAHPIVITDLEPKRLSFAKAFVPSCQTYLVDRSLDAQGNASRIRLLFGESEYEAPETVLECTGVESSVITAAYTVRRGGDLMVIGVGKDIMNNLPFMHISLAEVIIAKSRGRTRADWIGSTDQLEIH
jgi:L-iditol 2-dehydrogenase